MYGLKAYYNIFNIKLFLLTTTSKRKKAFVFEVRVASLGYQITNLFSRNVVLTWNTFTWYQISGYNIQKNIWLTYY